MRSRESKLKTSSPTSNSSDSIKTIPMRIENFSTTLPSSSNQHVNQVTMV